MYNLVVLMFASFGLAYVFSIIGLPIPYLIAPMLLTVWCKIKKIKVLWSISWRNLALIPIGYGLGEGVRLATCKDLCTQIPAISSSTFIVIGVSALYAYYISRRTAIAFSSSLIGNMPGGMTQMLLIGEEIKGTDQNVILVMQTIRLLSTIVVIPFVVTHAIEPGAGDLAHAAAAAVQTAVTAVQWWEYPIVLLAVLFSVGAAVKVKFPSAYMLGPLLAVALLNIFWHQVPHMPIGVLRFAQFFVGVQMGANIQLERMKSLRYALPLIIFSSVVIIALCFGLSIWVSDLYGYSLATAFLAMAPGGITEMSITALSVGADVAVILSYQLFRLIVLSTLMPVLITWYFNRKQA